jgi:hypothetical protein
MKAIHYIGLCAFTLAANQALASSLVVNQGIAEQEVLSAQQGWCSALVNISSTHEKEGQAAAKVLAGQVLDAAYGYQMGAVLFKPTLTVNPQTFRTTREGPWLTLPVATRLTRKTAALPSKAGRSARSITRLCLSQVTAPPPWARFI